MTTQIHKTSIIEDGAKIGNNVSIGPFCHIGHNAVLADNITLKSHIVIDGYTTIGQGTVVFPFTSLGTQPQDLKFNGEKTTLEIGENNTIREHVTMNPGTEGGGGATRVGNNCLFMIGSHIAHDCQIGNHVILANNATLAGHVNVGDFAVIGGLSAIHQFVRIGHHAMIGGMSGIENDVVPYGSAMGERATLEGLNLVGMKRRGFKRDEIHALRAAWRMLFAEEGTLEERTEDVLSHFGDSPVVQEVLTFIREENSRPLCQPKHVR